MTVTLTIHEDVAIVRIDDGRKNVINHGVLEALEAAWAQVESDAKAAILTGREGSFCAGYDISVMTGDDRGAAAELGRRGLRFGRELEDDHAAAARLLRTT